MANKAMAIYSFILCIIFMVVHFALYILTGFTEDSYLVITYVCMVGAWIILAMDWKD